MQKTLIDPFELASVLLPTAYAKTRPKNNVGQAHQKQSVEQADQEEPVERRVQPNLVPRGEAWARVRCWCSED